MVRKFLFIPIFLGKNFLSYCIRGKILIPFLVLVLESEKDFGVVKGFSIRLLKYGTFTSFLICLGLLTVFIDFIIKMTILDLINVYLEQTAMPTYLETLIMGFCCMLGQVFLSYVMLSLKNKRTFSLKELFSSCLYSIFVVICFVVFWLVCVVFLGIFIFLSSVIDTYVLQVSPFPFFRNIGVFIFFLLLLCMAGYSLCLYVFFYIAVPLQVFEQLSLMKTIQRGRYIITQNFFKILILGFVMAFIGFVAGYHIDVMHQYDNLGDFGRLFFEGIVSAFFFIFVPVSFCLSVLERENKLLPAAVIQRMPEKTEFL